MQLSSKLFKNTEIIEMEINNTNEKEKKILEYLKKNNEYFKFIKFYKLKDIENILIITGKTGTGKSFGIQRYLQENSPNSVLYITTFDEDYYLPDIKITEKRNEIKIKNNLKNKNKIKFIVVDEYYSLKNKDLIFHIANYFIDKNTYIILLLQEIKNL